MNALEHILVNYRWVFVVFFLMPLSFIYDIFFFARNFIVFRLRSAPHKHDERVKAIQNQVLYYLIRTV